MSYTRYKKLQKWVSNDNGISWVATDEYKKGEAMGEYDSLLECEDSGQDPNPQKGYRWINLPISEDWECFNGSKYYKQQRQYTTDKGQTWHDMDEYRIGSLFEMNASDCQHEEPQPPTPPTHKDNSIIYSSLNVDDAGYFVGCRTGLWGDVELFPHPKPNTNKERLTFDNFTGTRMSGFGYYTKGITYLKLVGTWENIDYVNNLCSSMEDLVEFDGSEFDFSKVVYASFMFQNCTKLETVDIYGLDIEDLTNISHIFYHAPSIRTIRCTSTMKQRMMDNPTNFGFNLDNSAKIGDITFITE